MKSGIGPAKQLQGLLAGLRDGELAAKREQLLSLAQAAVAEKAAWRAALESCRRYFDWPDIGYLQTEYRRLFNQCQELVSKALGEGHFANAKSRQDGAVRAAARTLLQELERLEIEDGFACQAMATLGALVLDEFPDGYPEVKPIGLAEKNPKKAVTQP